MFDVWFDGESVESVVMQQLETKLQEASNLPATKAAVLINGKSHRSSAVALLMKRRNYQTNLLQGKSAYRALTRRRIKRTR